MPPRTFVFDPCCTSKLRSKSDMPLDAVRITPTDIAADFSHLIGLFSFDKVAGPSTQADSSAPHTAERGNLGTLQNLKTAFHAPRCFSNWASLELIDFLILLLQMVDISSTCIHVDGEQHEKINISRRKRLHGRELDPDVIRICEAQGQDLVAT